MKCEKILVIGIIFLLVVFTSGSIGIKDEKLSLDFQGIVEKLLEITQDLRELISRTFDNIMGKIQKPPPDYEFKVTDVRLLKDCIQESFDTKESCLMVNVEIKNNNSESVDFDVAGKTIVTKDGRQLERYGGLYNTKELNGLCDTDSYYRLFPNARRSVGMCFPLVGKSDEPIVYFRVIANGKQKEHRFDLTPLIS